MKDIKIGFALTGSFCTIDSVLPYMKKLVDDGADVYPILSNAMNEMDSRFGKAEDFKKKIIEITKKDIMSTIQEVEPIGPKSWLDMVVVAPCTGNTMAKLANGVTDTSVLMACKAQLRNEKPVVLGIATNDGLSANAQNLGILLNRKNIYFVPFGQDDHVKKSNSLVADLAYLDETIEFAMKGKQLQPVLLRK